MARSFLCETPIGELTHTPAVGFITHLCLEAISRPQRDAGEKTPGLKLRIPVRSVTRERRAA
jgi:hypothetical protein